MPKKNNRISRKATRGDLRRGIPQSAIPKKIPRDKKWEFSFQHWEQRKYFGLQYENVDTKWFVRLLERLKELSSEKLGDVWHDRGKMKAHRIHSIDWDLSSISKDEFYSYIPKEYRTEETDVIQFQIGKGKGRVIGFLDFENTFQVVLLDPAHNMQLSTYNDRKKRKTDILKA